MPQTTPQTDPYAAYAQVHTGTVAGGPQRVGYASGTSNPPNGGQVTDVDNPEPNDPYAAYADSAAPAPKPPERFSTELMKEIPYAAGQAGLGALKGAGSTLDAIGHIAYPDWLEKRLTGKVAPDHAFDATNPFQSAGKGVEQAAEFLIPGLGEEDAVNAGTKLLPIGEKVAKPLSRIGYNAVTSGLINKEQGGGFVNGAVAGGAGGAVGEGFKALAPRLAESSLNIRKLDRAYGKGGGSIGRAALDETRGWRPGTVAASARDVMENDIAPKLENVTDRASVRRAPTVRGFLAPPDERIPLAKSPNIDGTLSRNITLFHPDDNPRFALPEPTRETPMSSHTDIFPEQLPNAQTVRSVTAPRATGTGFRESFGQIPGERGGAGEVQGVWMRRPEMSASVPPTIEANPSASLRGARGVLSNASGRAARQGERTTVNQLEPMATHLSETINGEPILENITPRQMLDLKRGFGNEFIHRWNPETMEGVKGIAAKTYHEMAQELHRIVPETEPLDRRYSLLAPIAKRAESVELNAPTAQRIAHRVAAHTGALTGGVFGAEEGYRKDGVPGALAGGLLGVALPEMITSPTAEMGAARMLNRGAKPLSRIGTGAVLQLDRKPKNN